MYVFYTRAFHLIIMPTITSRKIISNKPRVIRIAVPSFGTYHSKHVEADVSRASI